jgi:hypothetical protein
MDVLELLLARMGTRPEEFVVSAEEWSWLRDGLYDRTYNGDRYSLHYLTDWEVERLWTELARIDRAECLKSVQHQIDRLEGVRV